MNLPQNSIYWHLFDLPQPEVEYRFDDKRRWRIDYCWPEYKLAVECEGGQWVRGRHNRPVGFGKDMEKYNALALKGFYLLRFTPKEIKDGYAGKTIKQWFDTKVEREKKP